VYTYGPRHMYIYIYIYIYIYGLLVMVKKGIVLALS
jgi:hypothetical protein